MAEKKNKVTQSLEEYIHQTNEYIDSDRIHAYELLESILSQLRNGTRGDWDVHSELGAAAAKYLEAIQRSTEQKVKLAAIIHRREQEKKEANKITDADREDLFKQIEDGKG